MNTAAEALLIIVSSVLSLFLLVAIVALVKLVQVLKALKHITEQAEKVVDSAEEAAELFKKTAGPVALTRFIANITHAAFKQGKRKGD